MRLLTNNTNNGKDEFAKANKTEKSKMGVKILCVYDRHCKARYAKEVYKKVNKCSWKQSNERPQTWNIMEIR